MTSGHADLQVVIEEVGRLLEVFEAQLSDSLRQASHEFGLVGAAFQEIAAANERTNSVTLPEPVLTLVRINCERIGRSLADAVVGLQCHDRLAQRLGHIRDGLDHLQSLLGRERALRRAVVAAAARRRPGAANRAITLGHGREHGKCEHRTILRQNTDQP